MQVPVAVLGKTGVGCASELTNAGTLQCVTGIQDVMRGATAGTESGSGLRVRLMEEHKCRDKSRNTAYHHVRWLSLLQFAQ